MDDETRKLGAYFNLSARQLEIGHYLATTSLKMGEVAIKIGIAFTTLSFHRTMLYAKMGVNGRVALIHRWQQQLRQQQKKN